MIPGVIAGLTFLATVLAVIGIWGGPSYGGSSVTGRLRKYAYSTAPSKAAGGQTLKVLRATLSKLGKTFGTGDYTVKFEERLEQAGIPLSGSEFMVLDILVAVVSLALILMLTGSLLPSVLMASLGATIPWVYVQIRRQRRVAAFNRQIADALTTISNSLRAGYSFLQAMDVVSREMSAPISEEFSRTLKDMSLGATTEEALTNLAGRVGSDDLDLAVTAIIIQRQVGGNLSEVLDNIVVTIRERARIKGEIMTLTAQGRLSGLIIGLLPLGLALFLSAVNPQYIRLLFSHPLGRLMLLYAIFSEIIGVVLVRKIVGIEV
ncbi:MAG TPA: secretion system protein [Firmicutes bacterium]|nr:secretion system protein [Bacillota bacterium]